MLTHQTKAIDLLLSFATDTSFPASERLSAAAAVLHFGPMPLPPGAIIGSDRFELTPDALAAMQAAEVGDVIEDEDEAESGEGERADPATPGKRKRRTKAEMAEARAAEERAKAAEAARTERSDADAAGIRLAITATPEDRREPEGDASTEDGAPADDPEAEAPADTEAGADWDAEEEPAAEEPYSNGPISKDEVVALLNRYAAKHPKKAVGAKEVLGKYGSASLKDISAGDYNAIARELHKYLEAA